MRQALHLLSDEALAECVKDSCVDLVLLVWVTAGKET